MRLSETKKKQNNGATVTMCRFKKKKLSVKNEPLKLFVFKKKVE